MNAPYHPDLPPHEPHIVRKLSEGCVFCNEPLTALWRDGENDGLSYQVRCSGCLSRGPARDDPDMAVQAWLSVRPEV